jgi:hypothetical protein
MYIKINLFSGAYLQRKETKSRLKAARTHYILPKIAPRSDPCRLTTYFQDETKQLKVEITLLHHFLYKWLSDVSCFSPFIRGCKRVKPYGAQAIGKQQSPTT